MISANIQAIPEIHEDGSRIQGIGRFPIIREAAFRFANRHDRIIDESRYRNIIMHLRIKFLYFNVSIFFELNDIAHKTS